jgi:hypothetical protein
MGLHPKASVAIDAMEEPHRVTRRDIVIACVGHDPAVSRTRIRKLRHFPFECTYSILLS